MKQKFIEFLKANNALEQFKKEFETSDWNNCSLEEYLNAYEPSNYLPGAFDWDSTKVGMRYWCDIAISWNLICYRSSED